jgi:hypothetical protein
MLFSPAILPFLEAGLLLCKASQALRASFRMHIQRLLRSSSISVIILNFLQAGGKAFAVPTLANYHVYVSNPDQVKDLNNAPGRQLSFNGVLADVSTAKENLISHPPS